MIGERERERERCVLADQKPVHVILFHDFLYFLLHTSRYSCHHFLGVCVACCSVSVSVTGECCVVSMVLFWPCNDSSAGWNACAVFVAGAPP